MYPLHDNDRAETPPIDFDPTQTSSSLELIISGLPRTTLTAAQDRLHQIIQELQGQGENLPPLDIVSPATNDPLDYVWVSLAPPFKEVVRPDILEDVRILLDQVPELHASWRVSASRMDKTRQLYFQANDDVNVASLKTKLDNIFQLRRLDVQTSWVPGDGHQIFYLFVSHDAFAQLAQHPPKVDRCFYHPRRSRYIQPKFGLEVAINGIGDYSQAKAIINRYLQNTYNDGTDDPVVRHSRVEVDESVYCAVLRTPQIASQFLSDPFNLALGNDFKAPHPQYLYSLNTQGIPVTSPAFDSMPVPPCQSQDPSLQPQIDRLSATFRTAFAILQHVSNEQSQTTTRYERDFASLTEAFRDAIHAYSLNNLVTATQMEISTLHHTLDLQEMLKILIDPGDPRVGHINDRISQISREIAEAEARKSHIVNQLQELFPFM